MGLCGLWQLHYSLFAILTLDTYSVFFLQGMTFVFLVTFIGDYKMWKFDLPYINKTSGEGFEFVMHSKNTALSVQGEEDQPYLCGCQITHLIIRITIR